jgi:hypothetical protein
VEYTSRPVTTRVIRKKLEEVMLKRDRETNEVSCRFGSVGCLKNGRNREKNVG